jgi:hypothetical protein
MRMERAPSNMRSFLKKVADSRASLLRMKPKLTTKTTDMKPMAIK